VCGCGCVGLCVEGGGLLIAQNSAMFAQPVIRRAQVVTPKKPSRYARVERKPTEPANVTTATQLFGNFGAAVESVSNLLQDQLDVLQTMFVTPMVSQVEVAQAVNVRPRACFGLACWLALAFVSRVSRVSVAACAVCSPRCRVATTPLGISKEHTTTSLRRSAATPPLVRTPRALRQLRQRWLG